MADSGDRFAVNLGEAACLIGEGESVDDSLPS